MSADVRIEHLADELRAQRTSRFWCSRAWRLDQLDGISTMLTQNISLWHRALEADLGKSEAEAQLTEISVILGELRTTKRNLWRWMLPSPKPIPLQLQPAYGQTIREPYGATLIIGPWNYPLQLILVPLVGAIAAGNSAVVKPSELAPATSELLAKLLPIYVDGRAVKVIEGAVDETTQLLQQRWDLIFYTGNGKVARIVAEAAAAHLTPTVLELGGKSPAYVDASANLLVTARRLLWAKTMNAGQTCVAPDYLLVHREVRGDFELALRQAADEQLGQAAAVNPDYARIVNERHFERLQNLLRHGRLLFGGGINRDDRKIEPTVLVDVDLDSELMRDEIFGPILPLIEVDDAEGAIAFINERDKPLALYVYTEDLGVSRRFQQATSSGGLGVNVSLAHLAAPSLPFGGVGPSGMGAYHGKASFDAFSHTKSVMVKPTELDTLRFVYPPYGDAKRRIMKLLFG